jgi:hypothetical protein
VEVVRCLVDLPLLLLLLLLLAATHSLGLQLLLQSPPRREIQ